MAAKHLDAVDRQCGFGHRNVRRFSTLRQQRLHTRRKPLEKQVPRDEQGQFLCEIPRLNHSCDQTVSRFVVLQSYAHALFDGDMVIKASRPGEARDLRTTRAVGFVVAFLLPQEGIRTHVQNLGKGQPSRRFESVSLGIHEPIRTERRAPPGSQVLTYVDVAEVSARFGVDYVATVMRLLSLGIVSDSESRDLLSPRRQRAAEQWSTVVGDIDLEGGGELLERSFRLKAEVLHLAIEAYRRELITKDRFVNIGERLRIRDLSTTRLFELAQAAR
jgi:Zn-dependent peptidase ImmA (M78 family)